MQKYADAGWPVADPGGRGWRGGFTLAACNQMMQQEETTGGSSSPSSLATVYPPMETTFPTRPHLMRIKRSFFVRRRERESTSGASAMIYQAENTQVPHLWWVFLGLFFFLFLIRGCVDGDVLGGG